MDLTAALARYAGRLHALAGDRHHVASPLGAWLLLALTAAAGSASRDLAGGSASRDVAGGSGPRDLAGGSGSPDLVGGSGPRDLAAGSASRDLASGSADRDVAGSPAGIVSDSPPDIRYGPVGASARDAGRSAGEAGDLRESLGVSPEQAAALARELLDTPHPLVAAATAVWHSPLADPRSPADLGAPGGSGAPGGLVALGGSGTPGGSGMPGGLVAPVGSGTPGGSGMPGGLVAPGGSGTPGGSGMPGGLVAPGGSGTPDGPGTPDSSAAPGGPGAPDRVTGSGTPAGWWSALPASTAFGPLPDAAALDAWAREHTYGLVERFPVEPSPDLALLLASALATKVSWTDPFELEPAASLGGEWAGRLTRVLRSPRFGHRAFVTGTAGAGDVIVHSADADGLRVVSVAAAPGVPASEVMAAAYAIAPAVADTTPTSLFELPLGETPLWTIREEYGHDHRREHVHALLPAWSAQSSHDLAADPGLGFPAAAGVLGRLLGVTGTRFDARQAATARYSRYGFEAAAVTGFGVATSFPPESAIRYAELRFAHPYAVVAVAVQPGGPWDGVPVFSAWVSEPEDATDDE